jgi:hypothetical protein
MWYVMRYWKAKGVERLDLGGYAHYKKKYGPREIQVPVLMLARNKMLLMLRNMAYKAWSVQWKLSGRIKGKAGEREESRKSATEQRG